MTTNFPNIERRTFQGIPVSIETKAGTKRSGIDPNGEPWEITMQYDYGYIRGGIQGADGEELDCYIGPSLKASHAYIVKQHKIEAVSNWSGEECPNCFEHIHSCACEPYYDEDKVMLGFDSIEAAKAAYLAHYTSPLFLGPIVSMPMQEFKAFAQGMVGIIHFQHGVEEAVLDSASAQFHEEKTKEFKSLILASKDVNALKSTFLGARQAFCRAGAGPNVPRKRKPINQ